MKRLSRKQKFWAVLGAGLLAVGISGSALARQIEDRDVLHLEAPQEKKSAASATPLPEGEVEFTGTVEVMASDSWIVGGRTVVVTAATEIKPGLVIGALVKVHIVQQVDGTLWASEIEAAGSGDHNSNSNDNSNVNSNDDNSNDDHDGNVNSNDDNGDDDNSNVNSNDDIGDDDHGNGNVNSNDDHGNDDHDGNGNLNSNDDHGSNRNDDHGSGS